MSRQRWRTPQKNATHRREGHPRAADVAVDFGNTALTRTSAFAPGEGCEDCNHKAMDSKQEISLSTLMRKDAWPAILLITLCTMAAGQFVSLSYCSLSQTQFKACPWAWYLARCPSC